MRVLAFCVLLVACDGERPELVSFTPADGADLRGVGAATVRVQYSDASETSVQLFVDGVELARPEADCREALCTAKALLDTSELPIGGHRLEVRLRDAVGNTTTAKHVIIIDDILLVTSMQVANIVDESGTLEIEVYGFDEASGALLGCAGSRQGLGPIDQHSVPYTVDGTLIHPDQRWLATRDVASRLRLEVWEDDDTPVCPVIPDPLGNDVVGISPPRTVDEWRANEKSSFGNVTELGIAWSRPLLDESDPPTSDPGWHDGTNSGCSAAPSVGLLMLVLLAPLRRRRRQGRARNGPGASHSGQRSATVALSQA